LDILQLITSEVQSQNVIMTRVWCWAL